MGRSPRRLKIHPPERLAPSQRLDGFDCGKLELNDWLLRRATKAQKAGTAAVFVVRVGGHRTGRVIGYYATAMGSVPRVDAGRLGRNAPDPIPVAILARLAVDLTYQGRGLGQDMVADALKRLLRASSQAGMRAVVVHTFNPQLVAFYESLGFRRLEPEGRTMFIPIETLRDAL